MERPVEGRWEVTQDRQRTPLLNPTLCVGLRNPTQRSNLTGTDSSSPISSSRVAGAGALLRLRG